MYVKLKHEDRDFDEKHVIKIPTSVVRVSSESQQRASGNRTERVEAYKVSLPYTEYSLKTPISVRPPREEDGKLVYDLSDGWARLKAEEETGDGTIKATTWFDSSKEKVVEEDELFVYQVVSNNHNPSFPNTEADIAGQISKSIEKGWLEKWMEQKRPDPTKDKDGEKLDEWIKKAKKVVKETLYKEHKVATQTIETIIRKSLSKGKSEYYESYRTRDVVAIAKEDENFQWEGNKAGSIHVINPEAPNEKKTVTYIANSATHFNNTIKGWCVNQKQEDPNVIVKVVCAIQDTSTISDGRIKTIRDDLKKAIQDANKDIKVREKSPVDEYYIIGQIKTGQNKEKVGAFTKIKITEE